MNLRFDAMLEEYKKLYEENASLIPNWKKLDRNDLCFYYVDNKDVLSEPMKESYLSAIICKFWHLIQYTFKKQDNSIQVINEEDCYDCLISSILYVLDKAVWKNEHSSLYNDKKAPEKAISIRIKSISCNMKYLSLFTSKKKINHLSYSLDELTEESSDGFYLKSFDEYDFFEDFIYKYVVDKFNSGDYYKAIVFDMMCFENCFDEDNSKFDCTKILKLINSIDDSYVSYFCTKYGINIIKLQFALSLFSGLRIVDIESIVDIIKNEIRNNKNLPIRTFPATAGSVFTQKSVGIHSFLILNSSFRLADPKL